MVGLTETEKNLNYQLGQMVGSIIELKWLPTLSTDMLKTNRVIEVTDESDLAEHNRLQKLMDNAIGRPEMFGSVHKEWMVFYKPMSKKYLPKTIKCLIEKIEPTDLEEFKKGLNWFLWDTDLSHYMAEDGFFLPNDKHAWCSVIILTRSDT